MNYHILGNSCSGTNGIDVDGGDSVVVSDNAMPQEPGATNAGALEVHGEIYVAVTDHAIVRDNFVSSGLAQSQRTTKAIIHVTAAKGTISGNTVEGQFVAGFSGTDTAIKVGSGACDIYGNHYVGVGARWATSETPLSNEIVVTGSGSTISSNGAKVDVSAATNVRFTILRSVISSKEGVVSTTGGAARIPFREDAEIVSVSAMVDTAPTGAPLIVDLIDSADVTMFTTQANRPTILATEYDSGEQIPDVTAVASGSYVKVQVDQIGSTIAGSDLTVLILWRPA